MTFALGEQPTQSGTDSRQYGSQQPKVGVPVRVSAQAHRKQHCGTEDRASKKGRAGQANSSAKGMLDLRFVGVVVNLLGEEIPWQIWFDDFACKFDAAAVKARLEWIDEEMYKGWHDMERVSGDSSQGGGTGFGESVWDFINYVRNLSEDPKSLYWAFP